MSDYSVNASFDYNNLLIEAGVIYTGVQTGFSDMDLFMYNPDGTIASKLKMTLVSGQRLQSFFVGSGSFGRQYYSAGYDSSHGRRDISGLYYSDPFSNWQFSSDLTVDINDQTTFRVQIEYLYAINRLYELPNGNGSYYKGVPVVINRGDSVLNGSIATVANGYQITLNYDTTLGTIGINTFDYCMGKVISGTHSGNVFTVVGHTSGDNTLSVDRNMYAYSGEVVSIMPYRFVTTYSGWDSSWTGVSNNTGYGGLNVRLGTHVPIPGKLGSIYYTSGTFSGIATSLIHPQDEFATQPVFSGSVVALKNDIYLRDVRTGDLIEYNPNSDPTAFHTGIIFGVTPHGTAGEGDFAVKIWPAETIYTGSDYKIIRGNYFELQSYPNFSESYYFVAQRSGQYLGSATIQAPGAVLDFTANEFESTYTSVTETAHFHIGPVTLSNGQCLTESAGNLVYPRLRIGAEVHNGDVTSPTVVLNSTGFSTQNVNIGHQYNGKYYKKGVMTLTSSTAFNSSETIYCIASARLGSAVVDRVITVPVQPAI